MIGNVVQYNYFIGEEASLIYMNAGEARIYQNNFQFNGYLTFETVAGNPDQIFLLNDGVTALPYSRYSFNVA